MKRIFVLILLSFLFINYINAQVQKKADTDASVTQKAGVKNSTATTPKTDAFLKVKKKTPEQLAMQKQPSEIDSTKITNPHL